MGKAFLYFEADEQLDYWYCRRSSYKKHFWYNFASVGPGQCILRCKNNVRLQGFQALLDTIVAEFVPIQGKKKKDEQILLAAMKCCGTSQFEKISTEHKREYLFFKFRKNWICQSSVSRNLAKRITEFSIRKIKLLSKTYIYNVFCRFDRGRNQKNMLTSQCPTSIPRIPVTACNEIVNADTFGCNKRPAFKKNRDFSLNLFNLNSLNLIDTLR